MPIKFPHYRFVEESVMNASDQAGVYALYIGRAVIYYGSSLNSIRSRLQAHLSGSEGACTQSALAYNYELSLTPLARERELLHEHLEVFGRLPSCNDQIP